MSNSIKEWETLMDQITAITNMPYDSITHYEMMELRKLSMKLATLVYSMWVIIWEMKTKYRLKYWEMFNDLADMKKTATLSKEIATYEAEKEFWDYRKMEEARDWMIWVLKQIEWFSVQWNMDRKEKNSYIESWMKDLSNNI